MSTDKRQFDPEFDEFYSAEEDILRSKLRGIRATISHSGEKGRSVEVATMAMLRDFLPGEYGLSTGFVAYHDEGCLTDGTYDQSKDDLHITKQIDIIIYDSLRCGSIVRLGACDVFPLESVYAYVEVKTSITSKSDLVELFQQSERLRGLRVRLYWRTVADDPTGAQLVSIALPSVIPMRSYIFVLEATGLGSAEDIRIKIEEIAKEMPWDYATITGMYINRKGFYYLHPKTRGNARLVTDGALLAFKNSLYHGLSRYPRIPDGWTPAMDLYSRKVDA